MVLDPAAATSLLKKGHNRCRCSDQLQQPFDLHLNLLGHRVTFSEATRDRGDQEAGVKSELPGHFLVEPLAPASPGSYTLLMVVTTKTLVAEAAKAGAPDIDGRHISYLCRQGALPHAKRTTRVDGGWSYPALAPLQLRAYLPLRERMSLKDARFMLWVAGFPVDTELARETMVTYLSKVAFHWRAELAKHDSPGELVDTIGDVLSKARSSAPIPRVVDMPLAERRLAYRWMAEQMVATGEAANDDAGALAFERAIGRRDKNGALYPEFAGDLDFSGDDLPQTDPETLLRAAKGATKLELEFMRRFVHMQVVYGPIMIRQLAWEAKSASPFFQMVTAFSQQEPQLLIGVVAAGLARLSAKRDQAGYEDELRTHCDGLDSGKLGLALLEEFKDATFLDALPELDRIRVALELRRRDQAQAA